MSVWFGINLLVLLYTIWKVNTGVMAIHIWFGLFAFVILLYNWTRHAFFSTIRSNVPRSRKIAFARISKKALPYHKWTGSLAFLLAVIHMSIVIHTFGFQTSSMKMWSGLCAVIVFGGVALFGCLRWYHTTVSRRYVHWILAFFLFLIASIHVYL